MKIYLASSWRNEFQPAVLAALRGAGHEVYDFRNPAPGDNGFAWSDIEPDWQAWSASAFRDSLNHPLAVDGFGKDWGAMQWADACVLLLPSGRSAHIEAGYFVGAKKLLLILMLGKNEPELMYKMADARCLSVAEVIDRLTAYQGLTPREWWVFSTCIGTRELMVQCRLTGSFGVVPNPSRLEWGDAFTAPSRPYRWLDDSRVVIKREGPVPSRI